MKINLAHYRIQNVDCALFEANARIGTDSERTKVLAELTTRARRSGLHIDKSVLAYAESGRVHYYGTRDLVQYLAQRPLPAWTHTLDV
jgi:hypothetical protein